MNAESYSRTSIWISYDQDLVGSTCDVTRNTDSSVWPGDGGTPNWGVIVKSTVRAPSTGMAPVEPEAAPIEDPKLSNPTHHPIGDSMNKLYPC